MCKYDTVAGNETRTHALKRSVESLQIENAELHELIHHLRSRPRPEADEILNRLRASPSAQVSALLSFIKEGDLLAEGFARAGQSYDVNLYRTSYPAQAELAAQYPNVYSFELPQWRTTRHDFISAVLYETFGDGAESIWGAEQAASDSSESPSLTLPTSQSSPTQDHEAVRSSPMVDFARVPDGRIEQATCRPWTKVIHNDELFHRLLSIYFTWLHPSFCLFDQSLFLDDLITNDTDSRFCSPILVNAILSLAYVCCFQSLYVDKY